MSDKKPHIVQKRKGKVIVCDDDIDIPLAKGDVIESDADLQSLCDDMKSILPPKPELSEKEKRMMAEMRDEEIIDNGNEEEDDEEDDDEDE